MKKCGKITDKGTYRQYLAEVFPKDLASLIHRYIVPILVDKEILFPNRKPLSFSIMEDKTAGILFKGDTAVIDSKGKQKIWHSGNNYWNQLPWHVTRANT